MIPLEDLRPDGRCLVGGKPHRIMMAPSGALGCMPISEDEYLGVDQVAGPSIAPPASLEPPKKRAGLPSFVPQQQPVAAVSPGPDGKPQKPGEKSFFDTSKLDQT